MKQSAAWVIGSKSSKAAPDIFASARIKIALWYALIGLVILAVGAYLVYAYILFIIGDIIHVIQMLINERPAVSQSTGTSLISQAINADLTKMSIAVGIWIVFTMALSAYVLAEIILWPIRRAMERQGRFIANVSHELRTPLSVLRTNSEVALIGADDAGRDELVATIESNLEEIDRMSKITQFLLNFSNMENRLAKTKLARVDLVAIATDAMHRMQTAAGDKGVTLNFASNAAAVAVKGDAIALGEMTMNLLKNAVAYTPAGGTITIAIMKRGTFRSPGTILSIADTGVGISPEDLPNIFDAFYRGRNAMVGNKKEANSGLGLAIVKEIAALHRATISARSEVGKGTTISVRFPAFS